MNRRQILKSILLAPFAGLIKPRTRKKLNVELKMGEPVTVPKGQVWEIHKMVVISPTMGIIGTTTNTDHTYILTGYVNEY